MPGETPTNPSPASEPVDPALAAMATGQLFYCAFGGHHVALTERTEERSDCCVQCWADNHFNCGRCEESFWDNERCEWDGDLYCGDCLNETTFCCDNCGDRYSRDRLRQTHEPDYEQVCRGCCDEFYASCVECENLFRSTGMQVDDAGNYYCQSHARPEQPEEDDEPERRHLRHPARVMGEYHRKFGEPIYGTTAGPFPCIATTGLELEVEGGDKNCFEKLPEGVGVVNDGSLDASGAEVLTPPANGDALERVIRETCAVLKAGDWSVSKRTGLHVHVAYPRDEKKALALFQTYYAFEDLAFAVLPTSRLDNNFCRPLRHLYAFDAESLGVGGMKNVWYGTDKHPTDKYHDTRYGALNLHALWTKGTVEFRHHSGSLNDEKIVNWVRFLHSIVKYAMSGPNPTALAKALRISAEAKGESGADYTRKVQYAAELLGWPDDLKQWVLKRIEKHGAKRAPYPKDVKRKPMAERARKYMKQKKRDGLSLSDVATLYTYREGAVVERTIVSTALMANGLAMQAAEVGGRVEVYDYDRNTGNPLMRIITPPPPEPEDSDEERAAGLGALFV